MRPPRVRRLVLVASAAALGAACVRARTPPVTASAAPTSAVATAGASSSAEVSRLAPSSLPGVDAALASSWRHRRSVAIDLDGDGGLEAVVVASDVAVGPSGPIWEDGHRWAVLVEREGRPALVHAAFVPHGTLEAAALAPDARGARDLLVVERTPSGAAWTRLDASGRVLARDAHVVDRWVPALAP